MRSVKSAILYGVVVWIVPFVVAIFLFPLRSTERTLFESVMPVVLAATVLVCGIRYIGRPGVPVREGWILGLIWLAISLVLDLVMFSRGPMQMRLADYVKDIGLTYVMIPILTVGLAYQSSRG